MFSISRAAALRGAVWSVDPSNDVEYIEAWQYAEGNSVTCDNPRLDRLHDSKIEDWLAQKRFYSAPVTKGPDSKLIGGIRLIISERQYYRPPSYSMSEASYLKIEEAFHLPPATLHTFSNENGIFSRYLDYDENDAGKLRRIGIVIKAPQKYQLGNYGLSISHDFSTRITTGLLHGTGVMMNRNDFSAWPDCPSLQIFDLIKAVPHLWAHPMLLPTILLQHHIYRAEQFCNINLDNRAHYLQQQLGMSRAGRLSGLRGPYTDPAGGRPIQDTKVNLHNLSGDLSTCISELIWFCQVSEWECQCASFLSRTLDEIVDLTPNHADPILSKTRDIQESIRYHSSAAAGLKAHNTAGKERLQADFNMLCNLIAQTDNRLTAKMAATSSRDSSAMKTLAFITTLFLPGTFVATIFSTGMFNWQSDSSEPRPHMVSSYFWIYWAFTIPLTIMVAFSWRLWLAWEKRNLDHDVLLEIENIEGSASGSMRKQKEEVSVRKTQSVLGSAWESLRRRNVKRSTTEKEI